MHHILSLYEPRSCSFVIPSGIRFRLQFLTVLPEISHCVIKDHSLTEVASKHHQDNSTKISPLISPSSFPDNIILVLPSSHSKVYKKVSVIDRNNNKVQYSKPVINPGMQVKTFLLSPTRCIPNSRFPLLIYPNVFPDNATVSQMETKFRSNGWIPQVFAIINFWIPWLT